MRFREQGTALFLFWWIQGTKLKLDTIIFIGATAIADKTRKKSVKICCKVARKVREEPTERGPVIGGRRSKKGAEFPRESSRKILD